MVRHHSVLPHVLQHAQSIILPWPFLFTKHAFLFFLQGRKREPIQKQMIQTFLDYNDECEGDNKLLPLLISQRNNKAQTTGLHFGLI